MSNPNLNVALEGYEFGDNAEKPVETGYQRITYYNKDLNYHEGTQVANGGFGIDTSSGVAIPPFGVVEKLKHQSPDGKVTESEAMTASSIEVAIIAVSDVYTSYWPDGDKSNQPVLMPRYFRSPDGDKSKTRGGISLFVVFRCDPDHKVFELPVKTFNVDNVLAALTQIDSGTRALKRAFEARGAKITGIPQRYSLWLTLGCGETTKVGSEQQGNCTKIVVKWPKPFTAMKEDDFFNMRISPEESRQFRAYRTELDALMDGGFRKPMSTEDLPQLEEAYSKKAALNAAGQTERTGQSPARLGPAKAFDIEKISGGKWRLEAYLSAKGQAGIPELDDLIGVATRDPNYHIENALSDLGYDTVMDVEPAILLKEFIAKVIAKYNETR